MTPVSQSYILHQLTELDSIQQQVATLLQSHQIANEIQQDLRLIMDEIISNVFHYSHQGASCLVLLNITLTDHYCGLEFTDPGPAFNPLEQALPKQDIPITEREIGGLGIYLVRTLADKIQYQRSQDRNILSVIKFLN